MCELALAHFVTCGLRRHSLLELAALCSHVICGAHRVVHAEAVVVEAVLSKRSLSAIGHLNRAPVISRVHLVVGCLWITSSSGRFL